MIPSVKYLWSENLISSGGQIIQTVKYADDLALMSMEETVLHSMIDELIEVGRCYGYVMWKKQK